MADPLRSDVGTVLKEMRDAGLATGSFHVVMLATGPDGRTFHVHQPFLPPELPVAHEVLCAVGREMGETLKEYM